MTATISIFFLILKPPRCGIPAGKKEHLRNRDKAYTEPRQHRHFLGVLPSPQYVHTPPLDHHGYEKPGSKHYKITGNNRLLKISIPT